MGPQGCGFMYIAPKLHEKLKPAFTGWLSVKDSWNFLDYNLDLLDDAERYEIGTANALGIIGLKSSTDLLLEVNPKNTEKHLITLGDHLIDSLQRIDLIYNGSHDLSERSGIYSFNYKNTKKLQDLHEHLAENNIYVSYRNGAVRVSPHFYNDVEDIQKMVDVSKKYLMNT
jgi:selenocysteine lyase/cysteine desulfurase